MTTSRALGIAFKQHDVVNVKDPVYGAKGDGSTDDTVAIQAAITAAGLIGTSVYFPAAVYKFSTLTVDKSVKLFGDGWNSKSNAAFASSEWTTASLFSGTILRSTATSGVAITFDSASTQPYRMEGILLIGPGSGTSTGIKIGTAAHASVMGQFRDIAVSNFSLGWDLNALNEYTFAACRSRGNSSGFILQNGVNNCNFDDYEVQNSSVIGLNIASAAQCVFTAGLFQNITGTAAISIARNLDNLHFNGGWGEASTATWFANIGTTGSGLTSASFIGWRTSVTNGFNVDFAVGCAFINCRFLTDGLTLTANSQGTSIIGCNIPTFTDNSPQPNTTFRTSQIGAFNVPQTVTSQATNTGFIFNGAQVTNSGGQIVALFQRAGTNILRITRAGEVLIDGAVPMVQATTAATDLSLATVAGTQVLIKNTASVTRTLDLAGSNGGNPTISTSGGSLKLTSSVGDIQWGQALVALGAGGAATLGLTGGSGPATTTQNTWMRILDSTGAAFWVPAWK